MSEKEIKELTFLRDSFEVLKNRLEKKDYDLELTLKKEIQKYEKYFCYTSDKNKYI